MAALEPWIVGDDFGQFDQIVERVGEEGHLSADRVELERFGRRANARSVDSDTRVKHKEFVSNRKGDGLRAPPPTATSDADFEWE